MTPDARLAETEASYDTVARSYADLVREALPQQPYLLAALTLLADQVQAAGGGRVVDVGCGPGHVTAHLHELGVDALGIDLSPGMIDVARRDHPGLPFEVASMTDLHLPPEPVAGLLAWQSLIHIPDDVVPAVLGRFHRALRPGGLLQLLFHAGEDSWLKTEGYGGHLMNVRVYRRTPEQMTAWLAHAGFEIEAQMLLDPDGKFPQALLFAHRRT
ncbi:methyltransferase family protein [Actinomycetospora succinea]|uniref:Methyltransferase family protein n=1 Tax=Actinomycetospora succinea TaxID=663603 RepID=A0A4R6VK45_9PSEU|nr:class I SAM-dependent methyltransferase [Actinomycetospora succinea]TDQ58919.1 methyltransferase family protein [Actinomycetospora succinea]